MINTPTISKDTTTPQEKDEMRQRMDRLNNMSPWERKVYRQLHKKWITGKTFCPWSKNQFAVVL